MGVPKFFRYTSERYPCLNELVKQYQIPDFDNMYLDMNGIIHNCSHPDDSNPHFRITEEKIFKDIFHYISILFQIIKPKKLFFMAIDGVAPRAKMNQQRGRRFRSAREAENLEEQAKSKGEVLPTEKRFDSNCITPGTVFMARLHEQLRYFVKTKMSTDPLWSKVKVILSGHETPGEGEHKIMDYIRWARSQPDYEPNTRHCLYGLDADLIMLGMCTHEPHFALLREEVKFGKTTQRATSPEETNFYLLHLSLMRAYLEQEFISIKDKLPFEYDIEKIVDDWVLMGFLVGNDFIPHLPNMHISNDALPLLYKTYMNVLPTLDGYINEAGDLNLARFETFMQELAKIDKEKFQDTYTDLKYFVAKTGRRPNAMERKEYKPNNDDTFNVNIEDIKENKPDDELQALINATQEMYMDDMENDDDYEETSDEEMTMETEFILHKKDYYMNKLDYSKVTDEVLADQAEGYVRAIQWNLYYYYKGCPSWCWYYPHHYAPYISDIRGFKDLKIEFELGEPFKPFEQLLAVLPAASKHLLPTPFHDLMTDEDSPIVHYYPLHFETDLNGKKNDWEAVVLIPFIDETNLLSAMSPCYQRLTEEEMKRNMHGPMLVYNWTPENLGEIVAPQYFAPIAANHAIETAVWRTELDVPDHQLKRGMLPNVDRDILYPGFPTMRYMKFETTIKKCKVKVFDQPSRNESMIIQIIPSENTDPPLEEVAEKLLGKIIWVGWPHLTRAKIISVSNEKKRLHHIDKQNNNVNGVSFSTELNMGNLHRQWISERSTIIEHNMNRLGIELGDVSVIVHAVNLRGYKYIIQDNVSMVREEEWCKVACGYALQGVVSAVATQMQPPTKFLTPRQAYPPGDHCFLLTNGQYYGCMATVVSSEAIKSSRIKVNVRECVEPTPKVHAAACPYRAANHAAAACGVSTQMLSRITGAVLVVIGERNDLPTEKQNKLNIGLNLKFNKKNQEVSGYTRRCKLTNAWLYSERCIELVKAYARQFPDLFDKLVYSMNNDIFFESDLWPDEMGQKKPQEVVQWIKNQPHSTAMRRECGSDALEPEEMKALYNTLQQELAELKSQEKSVTLHVKWNLLFKPELHEGNVQPDPKADFKMYDRVICVARNITAPLGAKGTITAVYQPSDGNTVRLSDKMNAQPTYQVMFDEPFPGAQTEDLFEDARFYRMLPTNMLCISYGRKLRDSVSCADTQPFTYNRPIILRREDGHHSAFASYSPPRDIISPATETRPAVVNNNIKNGPQEQDNATSLLKSLLKISEGEPDTNKNKAQKFPEPYESWRVVNDTPHTSNTSTPNSIPAFWNLFSGASNWRSHASKDNNRVPPTYNDWTKGGYKNQPPMPPYPTFAQPFQGPGPSQVPFPQINYPRNQFGYQDRNQVPPRNQQNNHNYNNQGNQSNFGNQQVGNQGNFGNQQVSNPGNFSNQKVGNHAFPKHLPNVDQTFSFSSSKGQSLQSTSKPDKPAPTQFVSNGDKLNNPFIPLQAQTSIVHRRQQNLSGPSSRKDVEVPPQNPPPPPQPLVQAVPQKQQATSKPLRKKKTRIAANLPFQLD
ncbi:5'-3' exoribonuclease 1 isoform X1 [Maniola jurtina]|uniref:5'-3' exoribonuclease 1 isoform X1 n=1 Tax=Maniola jurtina TaxID=191418 RepID=UPI001E687006|nr:5'-3' exoribonuclease 1 isoform X1 [Maniola jurtina]